MSTSFVVRRIDVFFQSPVVTIRAAASAIGVSYPGAAWALNKLVEAGMVRELGPFKRGRMFFAEELVRRIEEDI